MSKCPRMIILGTLFSMAIGCDAAGRISPPEKQRDRYTVIGRANSADDYFVPVVLQHDGHKYYARCNNVKGVEDPKVTKRCELHVGMTVECQFFKSGDVSGYDLICGSKRNEKGALDTYGDNELLFIDKEEN